LEPPVPRHRFTAAVASLAVALSVAACTTPGVNDLYMPAIPDDLVQVDPSSSSDVISVYNVKGLRAEDAVAMLQFDGFSVETQDGSGPVNVAAGGWTVVGQELMELESFPVQPHVVLTVARL
jgi:hypothetical protein